MARLARVVVPGLPHHITQRGNRRQQTFFCDEDYEYYLELMGQWCAVHQVEIWAYCLMPNHVHLIAVPQSADGLRLAVGEVHRRYTRMVNFREGWRGHLWQGRFASFVLDEPYVLTAARYVELDQVRTRLVNAPEPLSVEQRGCPCARKGRRTRSGRSPAQVGATLAWVSREGHSGRGPQTPACSRANRTSRRRGVSGDARRKPKQNSQTAKARTQATTARRIPNGQRAGTPAPATELGMVSPELRGKIDQPASAFATSKTFA